MNSYKDLIVWQKSVDFSVRIYRQTDKFPKSELYGLTDQLRRASIAIPSNIAEGQRRGHRQEYIQFLRIAYGSGAEIETQLLIAQKIGYISQTDLEQLFSVLTEIMSMLTVLIRKLSSISKT